jgi:hypothetical protein
MAYLRDGRVVRAIICAILMGVLGGSITTYAVLQWNTRIPTTAQLKLLGVGVYKDAPFTVAVTEINWGILEPGDRKNFSAYIKNESNVPITLTMYTENWNPANATSFIGLSWDYQGNLIDVDGSALATFILNVDAATSGFKTFSFTIVIVGSG